MDRSKVKNWVDENGRKIIDLFGLQHWHVDIIVGRCPGSGAGECKARVEYERATIWLDHDEIDDMEELERIFKHEVAHILHSPMSMVWSTMAQFVETDSSVEHAMKTVWLFAIEMTAKNIERMHHYHMEKAPEHNG